MLASDGMECGTGACCCNALNSGNDRKLDESLVWVCSPVIGWSLVSFKIQDCRRRAVHRPPLWLYLLLLRAHCTLIFTEFGCSIWVDYGNLFYSGNDKNSVVLLVDYNYHRAHRAARHSSWTVWSARFG